MTTTEWKISDEELRALESEAAAAGDLKQVELCRLALRGNSMARIQCARVITRGTPKWG